MCMYEYNVMYIFIYLYNIYIYIYIFKNNRAHVQRFLLALESQTTSIVGRSELKGPT